MGIILGKAGALGNAFFEYFPDLGSAGVGVLVGMASAA
jgi:hypothetical protein